MKQQEYKRGISLHASTIYLYSIVLLFITAVNLCEIYRNIIIINSNYNTDLPRSSIKTSEKKCDFLMEVVVQ